MSKDRFDVFERFAPLFEAPEPSFERFLRRRERKLRNQRIAAGIVAIALFVAPVAIFAGLISFDRTQTPGAAGTVSGVPEVDYVIDLNTGAMTPLPTAILGSLGPEGRSAYFWGPPGQYAASPDGSQLAYAGLGDDGSLQIFIAGVDGTGVRQVTHDPRRAISPAWSPDGTRIAYEGYGSGDVRNIFVLDVATGESTQVTDESPPCGLCARGPVFTPDGSSLIYTGGTWRGPVLRIVPVTGGRSALLIDLRQQGLNDAAGGSLSPDGSLLTFMGSEIGGPGALRFVARPDGTDWRIIPECSGSNPAGTWSPDGSRIVCSGSTPLGRRIKVLDIATGDATTVAEGLMAIWLDDHTLLVEV